MPKSVLPQTLAILVAAVGLLAAMPRLHAALSSEGFYGLRTDLAVPPLAGATVPDSGLNVVFFGYRHCGSVCPAQLGNLKGLQQRMTDEPVRFVFVTLDPDRDSQAELDQLVAGLGRQFAAVRPDTPREAQALALAYGGSAYATGRGADYDISHAGHLYVVNGDTRKQLTYTSQNLDLDRVHQDLRLLLARGTTESR